MVLSGVGRILGNNLELEKVMRNLTCGDHQIFFMAILLVLTGVEIEEISYEKLGSHRLVSGGWRKVCEAVEIKCTFLGNVVGWFKCRKLG